MSLRELKKQQTRERIADSAWRLFAERGFDRVTVVEIARAAQVSEATVFNYFPAKEDLFFSRLEAFGERLVEAVRTRPPGESALTAFRRRLLRSEGLLAPAGTGDPDALERLRAVNRLVADSPALRAREQQTHAACVDALTEVLADDVTGRVAASALFGVHRALIDHVRRQVLADPDPTTLAADVRRLATEAFALLEGGMRDYGVTG